MSGKFNKKKVSSWEANFKDCIKTLNGMEKKETELEKKILEMFKEIHVELKDVDYINKDLIAKLSNELAPVFEKAENGLKFIKLFRFIDSDDFSSKEKELEELRDKRDELFDREEYVRATLKTYQFDICDIYIN